MANLQELYDKLNPDERQQVLDKFLNASEEDRERNFASLYNVIFKKIPPTPEEFLDPANGWISEKILDTVFPHIKSDFIEILNKRKNYEQVSMYGCTRQGKSFLAVLIIFYTIVWMHCLRDPNTFYKISPMKNLCIYILSFKYDKVYEVYLKPLYNLMQSSPRFHKVKQQDQVPKTQLKMGDDVIVYSKAALVGVVTLASGLQIVCGNDDELSVIGADILQAYISEIAFFIQSAGASEDQIMRFYSKVSERITATVGRTYASFTYLDTSANMADSLIENYILKTLAFDPKVYFKSRTRWEARPELFPIYNETGETFTVCTGDGNVPAKILEPHEVSKYPSHLILNIPIDVTKEFKKDLLGSIRDIAGKPTSAETKFIPHKALIDNIFTDSIFNIEGIMTVDAMDHPDQFIWNIVRDEMFYRYNNEEYILKRAPKELRFITLDIAFAVKGDVTGFAMSHLEVSSELNALIHVVDLAFAIGLGENGINIQALECFIKDLSLLGQVPIASVTADSFESKTVLQNLAREDINSSRLSVDRTLDPYMYLYTCLLNNTLKAGKNIFLRNNLDSLYRVKNDGKKEKIDHSSGDRTNIYNGDWDTSISGRHAKDVSDAVAGSIFKAKESKEIPSVVYETENAKAAKLKAPIITNSTISNADLKVLYKKLHKAF